MDKKVSLEAMLHLAAVELDELEYQEFKEMERKHELGMPSDKFIQKMQTILNKEKRSDNFLHFRKALSKAAMYFLISFSMLSMTFLSASAVRESVADVIIKWYDGFTRIFVVDEVTPPTIGEVEFGFIPDDFKIIFLDNELQNVKRYSFENTKGMIFHVKISLSNEGDEINIDNDTLVYHKLVIDDVTGLWLEDDGYNTIIISNDGFIYTINGKIDLATIIKIYKNINIM